MTANIKFKNHFTCYRSNRLSINQSKKVYHQITEKLTGCTLLQSRDEQLFFSRSGSVVTF